MASIAFPSITKSIHLPSGVTYDYAHVEPVGEKPYLLFLHGWPDSAWGWRHQVPYFRDLGYGLIVPDLLGYGGTDKPLEADAYKLRKMCIEVAGILDAHKIEQVIAVGHDWGSIFLSRFANHFPERFSKLVFLDVGYGPPPPKGKFSVDEINKATEHSIGYPIFGYWHFFNDDNAGKVMDEHPDSLHSLMYAADPLVVKDNMCYPGATKAYLEQGKTSPKASWITNEEIATHGKIFEPSSGGFTPSLNWYKAQIRNLNAADDINIEQARYHLHQPTLLVTCCIDYIGVAALQQTTMRPYVKNLTVEKFDTGHWVAVEKANELNKVVEAFIK